MTRRLRTGCFQYEGDWPGYFIRGDDCMRLVVAIRKLEHYFRDGTNVPDDGTNVRGNKFLRRRLVMKHLALASCLALLVCSAQSRADNWSGSYVCIGPVTAGGRSATAAGTELTIKATVFYFDQNMQRHTKDFFGSGVADADGDYRITIKIKAVANTQFYASRIVVRDLFLFGWNPEHYGLCITQDNPNTNSTEDISPSEMSVDLRLVRLDGLQSAALDKKAGERYLEKKPKVDKVGRGRNED